MNLIRRPLLCAAMAMSAACRWSAFWQMRCPTLSQSPSPPHNAHMVGSLQRARQHAKVSNMGVCPRCSRQGEAGMII